MKRTILSLSIVLIGISVFAGKIQTINLSSTNQEFTVTKNETIKFSFRSSFSTLVTKEIVTKKGLFTQLVVDGYVNDGAIGNPALPALKKLIEMPYGSEATVNIISYDEEIVDLNTFGISTKVSPFQPSMRKDQDPIHFPFSFNAAVYNTDNYNSESVAEVQYVGINRGVRMGRLVLRPVQYNPVQNKIRILKNIVAEVVFTNSDMTLTENMKAKYYSPFFSVSNKSLINYQAPSNKDMITTYPVKYLIISDRMFETELQSFIDWKTKKGFKVVTAYTDVIGTTTTAIKNYISAQYNGGTPSDPAPTFLLLVGDIAQIPAFPMSGHVTDLYYGEMDGGGDVVPDIYYGRFSAQNTNQLTPQISKTLQYEQYTMPDPSFLQYSVLVAGVDAGNAPTYGNGQINYAAGYCNSSNGITSHTYLYGSGSPIISNSAAAAPAIHQNVSDGAGFVNYTAHCGSSGWSDPSFTTSDVAALTNQDKYCFMIGNCCQSNMFDVNECFGEAILRGNNKGAIGYIGASDYSYWNEDYYFSVGAKAVVSNPSYDASKLAFYDRLFHTTGEPEAEWYASGGQIMHAGNLAVTQNGSNVTYYWEEYHLMGDPSLMPYLGVPTQMAVSYQNSQPMGVSTINVTTEPYAYVGLSLNNVWVDAKYTGATGIVSLDISTIVSPCTLDVVVTKQNRQPFIGTLALVPNNAPYVVYDSHVMHDAGVAANGNVEYSENVDIDLTLKNVGNLDATNIIATMSINNPDISITDNTENYGNITANSTLTKNNAFAFTVNNVIADQQTAQFTITATDGGSNTWNTNFNVMLNAPVMQATTVTIDDAASGNGNGRLDPGETVLIKILTLNSGHAVSPVANSMLTINSGAVTIPTNTQNLGVINDGASVLASFSVNIDPGAVIGSIASFTYDVDAGGYTASKSFSLTIGLIVEDFESNTFTQYPWNTTQFGNAPWIIINSGSIYEGNYSARSGAIGNGTWQNDATSELTMQIDVISSDSISFYKKVSSEINYDFLTFFIDGVEKGAWSGEVDWSREAYLMTTGNHTLKWVYSKDYSTIGGQDAAWIDFVIFPPIQQVLNVSDNNTGINNFGVYPNPANSESVVVFNLSKQSNIKIDLLNTLGQTVKSILPSGNYKEGYHSRLLLSDELSPGIYFCRLSSENNTQTVKVVVTNK